MIVVEVDLRAPSFVPGRRLYARVQRACAGVLGGAWTWRLTLDHLHPASADAAALLAGLGATPTSAAIAQTVSCARRVGWSAWLMGAWWGFGQAHGILEVPDLLAGAAEVDMHTQVGREALDDVHEWLGIVACRAYRSVRLREDGRQAGAQVAHTRTWGGTGLWQKARLPRLCRATRRLPCTASAITSTPPSLLACCRPRCFTRWSRTPRTAPSLSTCLGVPNTAAWLC
jgi:hypothetical protein